MKKFLMFALFGLTALLLINVTSPYTGVFIPFTRLSLGVSALLGIPGVIALLLFGVII